MLLAVSTQASLPDFVCAHCELLDLSRRVHYSRCMPRLKQALKYLLGGAFALAGANHFLNTSFYVAIMPAYLPFPVALVYLSGVLEIMSGIALLVPRYSHIGAWAIMLVCVLVFPANINMALHADLFPQFSETALWMRLPLQAVIIAWACWYTVPVTSASVATARATDEDRRR